MSTTLILGCLAVLPATQEESEAPIALVEHALIEYLRTTDIGASNFGVVEAIHVELGKRVAAEEQLGHLLDDDIEAEIALQRRQAESTIQMRLSKARRDEAQEKLRAAERLARREALSPEEFRLRELEAVTADLAVEEATYQHQLAELQLQEAQSRLRLRQFIAPHAGVVIAIEKDPGEPVSPNEPVIRIVDTDNVRVTGHLDVRDSWIVSDNQPVRISPVIGGADLEIEHQWFEGRVVFVDPEIDHETQTCRIVAEVPNPDGLLRAGIEARMEILPFRKNAVTEPVPPAPRGGNEAERASNLEDEADAEASS